MKGKSAKAKLRSKADKLWFEKIIELHPLCEVCKNKSQQGHHFFPKGLYPQLRFEMSNGCGLCKACHFRHHHLGDPSIHATIIYHRGKKWYSRLKKQSQKLIKPSYQTIVYYEGILKQLKECILKKQKGK